MKLRVFVGCAAGFLAATVPVWAESSGRSSGIRINLDELPPPSSSQTKPAPKPAARPSGSAPAGKPAPKKEAPPPQIDGMEISRGERGYLGVKIDGGFRIAFYDRQKKPMPADIAEIVLRWPVHYQPNDERAALFPDADGKVLSSPKIVRRPYQFKLYLTLLKSAAPGGDPTPEHYVVDFSQ